MIAGPPRDATEEKGCIYSRYPAAACAGVKFDSVDRSGSLNLENIISKRSYTLIKSFVKHKLNNVSYRLLTIEDETSQH